MIPRFQLSVARAGASHGWGTPIMEEAVVMTPILSVQPPAPDIMSTSHIIAQQALLQAHSPSAVSVLRLQTALVQPPLGWIVA